MQAFTLAWCLYTSSHALAYHDEHHVEAKKAQGEIEDTTLALLEFAPSPDLQTGTS